MECSRLHIWSACSCAQGRIDVDWLGAGDVVRIWLGYRVDTPPLDVPSEGRPGVFSGARVFVCERPRSHAGVLTLSTLSFCARLCTAHHTLLYCSM